MSDLFPDPVKLISSRIYEQPLNELIKHDITIICGLIQFHSIVKSDI